MKSNKMMEKYLELKGEGKMHKMSGLYNLCEEFVK
jgi:hypothetical protein